jgi:hypothetical protein
MNNDLGIDIRDFNESNSFSSFFDKLNNFVHGEIIDTFFQLATYSHGKVTKHS